MDEIDRLRCSPAQFAGILHEVYFSAIFENEWDILQTNGLAAMFEIRNLGCWKDTSFLDGLLTRKSSII